MSERLAIAHRRMDRSKVRKSKSCASFDGNAGCHAAPAPDAPTLRCDVDQAAEQMEAKGEPCPKWSRGRLEPRAKAAKNKADAHAQSQILLYVTNQRISILIDEVRLQFRRKHEHGSNVADDAVNDGNHLHAQESIHHWLTPSWPEIAMYSRRPSRPDAGWLPDKLPAESRPCLTPRNLSSQPILAFPANGVAARSRTETTAPPA